MTQTIGTADALEDAYLWICERRKNHSYNNDVWDVRFNWTDAYKEALLKELNDGTYTFSPLQRYEFDDDIVSMWSTTDMIVLKLITNALHQEMKPFLSKACYHTKSHGGLKKALVDTFKKTKNYSFVLRSDIKGYYESIRLDILIKIIECYVKNPILLHLIMKALRRVETFGGNFYDYTFKSIPKRSPLSPLLSAIALLPLDQAMENNPHIFYARFVDDWIVFAKSKTMLRKVIKKTRQILDSLYLEMHPKKTYIGKIEKGFNFLTYFIKPGVLMPSIEALRRFDERCRVLYEQASPSRFRRRQPKRDISEYYVNEQAPTDLDMQNILFSLFATARRNPKVLGRIQTYIRRWVFWLKCGLKAVDDFERSVNTVLPTLALCWTHRTLTDVISNIIIC